MNIKTAQEIAKKYEDWWAKHNVTSRTGIFTFILIYLLSIIFALIHPVNPEALKVILDTTGYIALLSILAIIFGPNTFVKIAQIIMDKKNIQNNYDGYNSSNNYNQNNYKQEYNSDYQN